MHRESNRSTVLLAVNMHEGLDLKDDLARFLIIPKVLFEGQDEWTKARERIDPGYRVRTVVARMVQACGRAVRSADDWAYIIILDGCFRDLIRDHASEFPSYFLRSFHESSYIE